MEILFCDECGMRFSGEATPDTPRPGGEQKRLCDACRAKQRAAKPSNRQLQPARVRSERLIPAVQGSTSTRPVAHHADTVSSRHPSKAGGSRTAILVFAGGAVVLLVIVAGFLGLSREPDPGAERKVVPVTPAPPPAQQTAATQVPQQPPVAASTLPAEAKAVLKDDKGESADDAFSRLIRFDGLAADDREGRIRRIDEFLSKYGQEIVASRARVMLRELQAPPAPPPAPVRIETPPPTSAEPIPTEGWKPVNGPFTFEDGQTQRWEGDLGSRVDAGEFEGRKCLRLRPGDQRNCRAFHGPSMDSAGLRVRFRYFAHDVDYVEVLWAQGSHRPRKHIEPLVRDGWADACFTGEELGGNATRLGHIEIGGPAKSAEAFVLIDNVVWEKR